HALRGNTWGIFAPLYAAHTRKSWGAGDLGDLQRWREWVTELGGGVVATLPMLAQFDDEPSPYSPVSRLFWNELYLDLTRMPEFDANDRDASAIAQLRAAAEVDYAGVLREKRRVLEKMCDRFLPDADFEAFAANARDYAEFRARIEQRESAQYHLYVQYRMAQQMREVAAGASKNGPGLYLDFPLGVNPGGYDAHRYAHVFAKGVSVGAPPDVFFTKGQNWGFPPFDPDAIREDRYEYFRAAIRHHVSHAGILRLDHVMGLHRLYWIAEGAEAKDGVYVTYRADELYAIVALESTRHRCAIVGEDLGTVPPYVPKMMDKHALRRMYVVQYEAKPEPPALPEPPRQSVASVNTHDMPTFAAFWDGLDVDDRVEQGLLDERGAAEERERRGAMREAMVAELKARGLLHGEGGDTVAVLEAVLANLSSSAAEIVLVNVEDLWLEREPQNVPGVPGRSWRRKFRHGLEEVREEQNVTRILRTVNDKRRKVDGYTT
ncbi:MAG TPA: 4-alpha-glucanotransferase, partial [Thermoanaerobaculia bacterium]